MNTYILILTMVLPLKGGAAVTTVEIVSHSVCVSVGKAWERQAENMSVNVRGQYLCVKK